MLESSTQDWLHQWKFCCSGHCQYPAAVCCSSMPLNMLQKLSSWTIWWSIFRHWSSGLDEPWRSWVMLAGLIDVGKSCLLLKWEETGLVITDVLEISKLISELLSLPLLQEPSFSFFRWWWWWRWRLTSFDESLFFRDSNCTRYSINSSNVIFIWKN